MTSHDPVSPGLLLVDKPAGMTSHDVVARVRRVARTRKVGHAGTLDPMATGVLILGVGKATRLLGHLALADKSYSATVRLGVTTTTDDADGEQVEAVPATEVSAAMVRGVLPRFAGVIEQVPSTVSAIKVGGRAAHARVRAGEEVVLAPRTVVIHELAVTGLTPGHDVLDVDIEVRCSSGTYVRALARDVGQVLGVGGHLTALRRTAVGSVTLADAAALADLERVEDPRALPVLPMAQAARRFFPVVSVGAEDARDVGFGRPLRLEVDAERPTAVLGPAGELLALYRSGDPGFAKPLAVLL